MNRATAGRIAVDAFFDSFSCAALFGKLRIPGAPREIVDLRTVEQFQLDERIQNMREAMATIEKRNHAYFATEEKRRAKSARRAVFHQLHPQLDNLTTDEASQKRTDDLPQPILKPLENPQQSR